MAVPTYRPHMMPSAGRIYDRTELVIFLEAARLISGNPMFPRCNPTEIAFVARLLLMEETPRSEDQRRFFIETGNPGDRRKDNSRTVRSRLTIY